MRRPAMEFLAPELAHAARDVAEALRGAGHRAWIVGGAVRDLALSREPVDVDMASAATPEEVERVFRRVISVGRAFGTLVIPVRDLQVQLSTFRGESGYSDARRPDAVHFGRTLEEDARRRDFTCNALYLDPLDGTLADPEGGLADIAARRLACVGDAAERFREDGLRLVRMARFAAALEFEVDPDALAAARANGAALAGVSAERRLAEFELMFARRNAGRALSILLGCELLEPLVPGQGALFRGPGDAGSAQELRRKALDALGEAAGLSAGLCVLLEPEPAGLGSPPVEFDASLAVLEALRPSRATRAEVLALWRDLRELEALLHDPSSARSRRVRLARSDTFAKAERIARAWRIARGEEVASLDEFARWMAALSHESPALLVTSSDLAASAIPRGPRWSELLREAETLQLDGVLRDREQALAWLARQSHDGGNSLRKAKDSG